MSTSILGTEQDRARLIEVISALNLTKPWEVVIRRKRARRSLSENAWMHAMFQEIAEGTGNTIEDVKEAYKAMFLGHVPVMMGGQEHMVVRSTTSLDTKEAAAFCKQIHAHALTELGIYCVHPGDRGREAA